MDTQRQLLSSFNFSQKYARYNEPKQRRETWDESIERVIEMHKEHLGEVRSADLDAELSAITKALKERRILGSQRSLQFGGRAVLDKHARSYNCSACYVDAPSRFGEALYLLLCGVGVGYSVQDHHVAQLPSVKSAQEITLKSHVSYKVHDSIEGWSDAFSALIDAYLGDAPIPSFDFSEIRPKGAPIKSCGGKAPSAYPLRVALTLAENLLIKRAGTQLSPSDASDMMCILADCVLAGGVRRSALLCLFSVDTEDPNMLTYKSANEWWINHPYRARANISALVLRDDPQAEAHFQKIFEHTKNYGEPAVIWADSTEVVYNPCVEIGMCPTLIRDPNGEIVSNYSLDMLNPKFRRGWEADGYTYETAFQFCNLCEINTAIWADEEDAYHSVKLATILGCIQASYTGTEDDYLRNTATKAILERESLLGVSLTGLCSASEWVRSPHLLESLAGVARDTALAYYERCGLKTVPARVTCVKPSGNASVNLGCASGVHYEHSRRYIRRVQAPKNCPITQAFMAQNPHAVEDSVWSPLGDDFCVSFALEAPTSSLIKEDHSATDFLKWVSEVQRNWVRGGTLRTHSVESLTHNVSNTCTVRADEWDAVASMLLNGRDVFGGVSCLGASGDYDYPQAPFQAVYAPEEIAEDDPLRSKKLEAWQHWNDLKKQAREVDYTLVTEYEDNTNVMLEPACAGGACEI